MQRHHARATWVSRNEISIFCLDFSGFQSNPAGLRVEIEASDAAIRRHAPGSMLLAIDLNNARLTPSLVAYLESLGTRSPNPLRKVAVIGLSSWQRLWDRLLGRVLWPRNAAFFSDWEAAKAWLVGER